MKLRSEAGSTIPLKTETGSGKFPPPQQKNKTPPQKNNNKQTRAPLASTTGVPTPPPRPMPLRSRSPARGGGRGHAGAARQAPRTRRSAWCRPRSASNPGLQEDGGKTPSENTKIQKQQKQTFTKPQAQTQKTAPNNQKWPKPQETSLSNNPTIRQTTEKKGPAMWLWLSKPFWDPVLG